MKKYNEEQMEAVYEDYKRANMESRSKLPLKTQELFTELDSLKDKMESEGIALIFLAKVPTKSRTKSSIYSWGSFMKDQKKKVSFNLEDIISNYKKSLPVIIDMCSCMSDLIALYMNARVLITDHKKEVIIYDTNPSAGGGDAES